MGHAMSELPLAMFTVLASVGAGAFIALAAAHFSIQFNEGQQAKVDRATWLPVAIVVAGFVCAFFHLADPLHAPLALSGLGRSPMTNEIAAGIVFAVVAIAYALLANRGKISSGSRRAWLAIIALLALAFGLLMGFAYVIDTVQSWNTWATPVEIVGLMLLGGAALGMIMLTPVKEDDADFAKPVVVLGYAGAVLAILPVLVMSTQVGSMSTALYAGSDLVGAAMPAICIGCVAVAVASVCTHLAIKRGMSMASVAIACAIVGALALRLAFYAMQLSVGLSVL